MIFAWLSWVEPFRESLVSKLVMYILRLHKLDKLNVKVNDDDPEVLL